MPTFAQLQDDAALLSFEHQLHLSETIGEHAWEATLDRPRFAFTGDHPLVVSRFHLLGSAAPGPGSWLWSWANPSGYPEEITALADGVRRYGEEHGIPELASPEVPFAALPGSPTEPALAAALMTEAAKAVSGRYTSYSGPVGGGTRMGVLLEHPDLTLPPPEPARVARILQQSIMDLELHDHRRAFLAYARQRAGLSSVEDGTRITVLGPGIEIAVEFNENNLVTAMSAKLGAGR